MNGQSNSEILKRIWQLVSIEGLGAGMSSIGNEMRTLDFRNETELVFEGGGRSGKISYEIIDKEITLFKDDGDPLGPDIIWKIELVTEAELDLLLITREKKRDLMRFRYRAKV